MELRNADGGVAETSGNGLRCLAQAAVEAGWVAASSFGVLTAAGLRTVDYEPGGAGTAFAWVGMGHPELGPEEELGPGTGLASGESRSPGGSTSATPPRARRRRPGPHRRGAQWALASRESPTGRLQRRVRRPSSPDGLRLRVWERGVGETRACGTGSVAAAAVTRAAGLSGDRVRVRNPGGHARGRLHRRRGPAGRPRAQGGRHRGGPQRPVGGRAPVTPDQSAFTDTLISRAVRERIVLVGRDPAADDAGRHRGGPRRAGSPGRHGRRRRGRTGSLQRRDRARPFDLPRDAGKADELRAVCLATDADTVVFDDDLTPAQQRNLEQILGRTAIDRTAVILDIFAQNARTPEGRAQVELALLRYRLPRLRGRGRSSASRPAASAPGARARPSSRSTAGG